VGRRQGAQGAEERAQQDPEARRHRAGPSVACGEGERPGDLVVAGLERGEAAADLVQTGEVVGGQDFALDDEEADFRPV
jgi:hypothetical protein